MDTTPTYFLIDPNDPECFRLTRRGREVLGPRFMRQGIPLDSLRTLADWEAAVARVTRAEFAALSADQRDDDDVVNAIFDLEFCLDPLAGLAARPLGERRAQRDRAIQAICDAAGIDLT